MQQRNAMGARIRELRQERGLSLQEVAAKVGIASSHLSRIERGGTAPSFTVASRIAVTLGMSANDLASIQREQTSVNDQLAVSLMDRGMDPVMAHEVTTRISTPARRALLEVIASA
jgi:transcriptional regulator with XRE-family HTH domain